MTRKPDTIQRQLDTARAKLEHATRAVGAATAAASAHTITDPGALSGIRRRPNARADRRRADAYTREALRHRELTQLRNEIRRLELELDAARAELTRHRFSSDELAGATLVRDRHGWHRVVRISAKSVTVETGYSWTDRVPIENVLQAHRPDEDAQ